MTNLFFLLFIKAMLEQENWKDLPGYEGYYLCSDLGRVKSLDREITTVRDKRKLKGRILKEGLRSGYKYVNLWNNGASKNHDIHVLVMRTFVGECPQGFEVDHGAS